MTRGRKDNETQLNILDLLPPGRRQEILAEALFGQIAELYRSNPDATVGELVDVLNQHDFWDSIKDMKFASIFTLKGHERPAQPGQPGQRRRRSGRLADDLIQRVYQFIQTHPGMRVEQIRDKMPEENDRDLKRAIAQLREEGKVLKQGERRSTTYSAA
ncbi:MAG TPA: hypothetical protein VH877_20115 [Polyangia bacterium]|jgi:hypothetical protein|nr:hypothetical protein [Polyangia bacterium]